MDEKQGARYVIYNHVLGGTEEYYDVAIFVTADNDQQFGERFKQYMECKLEDDSLVEDTTPDEAYDGVGFHSEIIRAFSPDGRDVTDIAREVFG